MNILVIGDTHIPDRASWLPDEVSAFIESKEFDIIVCTGDLTDRSVLKYFKGLAELVAVRGNMDYLNLPNYELVEMGSIKAGVIHGSQVRPRGNRRQLAEMARKLDVDVLISGHTHSAHIYRDEVLLLNPGSATGAWGGGGMFNPSFMLLKVEESKVGVELYELKHDIKMIYRENFTV